MLPLPFPRFPQSVVLSQKYGASPLKLRFTNQNIRRGRFGSSGHARAVKKERVSFINDSPAGRRAKRDASPQVDECQLCLHTNEYDENEVERSQTLF
jgi:hypothetical protein